uniref:Uncharacterized protein n=1 Tax=Trichinella nativa TaxID=6335 RepID=A0A0V1INN5_9BILA
MDDCFDVFLGLVFKDFIENFFINIRIRVIVAS